MPPVHAAIGALTPIAVSPLFCGYHVTMALSPWLRRKAFFAAASGGPREGRADIGRSSVGIFSTHQARRSGRIRLDGPVRLNMKI